MGHARAMHMTMHMTMHHHGYHHGHTRVGCTPPHATGRAHHVLDALAAGLDCRADLRHALLQVAERELSERTRHQLAHLLRVGPGSGAGPAPGSGVGLGSGSGSGVRGRVEHPGQGPATRAGVGLGGRGARLLHVRVREQRAELLGGGRRGRVGGGVDLGWPCARPEVWQRRRAGGARVDRQQLARLGAVGARDLLRQMERGGSDGERGQRWREGAAWAAVAARRAAGGSLGRRRHAGCSGRAWHACGGALSTAGGAASRYLQPVGGRLAVGGARGEVVQEHVALDEVVIGHALAQRGGQAGRAEERIEDAHRPPATHRCSHEMYRHGKRAAGGEQASRPWCTR